MIRMIGKFVISVGLVALVGACAFAGSVAEGGAQIPGQNPRGTELGLKFHKIDLLNQILPVLMTPDQIKKILPSIEKARENAVELKKREITVMEKYEAEADAAIKKAIEEGVVPGDEILEKLEKLYKALSDSRVVEIGKNSAAIIVSLKEHLNEGQLKAASNSLDLRLIRPGSDVSSMDDDAKLVVWVQLVLMDTEAYPLLVELSNKKD